MRAVGFGMLVGLIYAVSWIVRDLLRPKPASVVLPPSLPEICWAHASDCDVIRCRIPEHACVELADSPIGLCSRHYRELVRGSA